MRQLNPAWPANCISFGAMEPKRKIRLTAAVVVLTVTGAGFGQQQPVTDPYNPQNRRTVTSDPTNGQAPSLMNMGAGTDQDNIGPFVTVTDKQFAKLTAMRAMMELELGKAATDKGSTEGVRVLGQRMVSDYNRWMTALTHASERLKMEIPAALDSKHRAEVDKITALSGPAFDEAYLKEMIRLQNKALTLTEFEATNAGVTGFRRWASAVAPSIEQELVMAKQSLNDMHSAASHK